MSVEQKIEQALAEERATRIEIERWASGGPYQWAVRIIRTRLPQSLYGRGRTVAEAIENARKR